MAIFVGIKFNQIKTLIDIIYDTEIKDSEIIGKRYKNYSDNYLGVKNFLIKLRLIRENNKELSFLDSLNKYYHEQISESQLKSILLERLMSNETEISNEIYHFLNNFTPNRKSFSYKPKTSDRVQESHIRNLFMELDLIEYENKSGFYWIADSHFNSFEIYLNSKALSPAELDVLLNKKQELGSAAELTVLEFENKRLSAHKELKKKIDHVALNNVLAGYDILSWDVVQNKMHPIPRFIEVKAVSRFEKKFFLTRNEIAKASEYGDRYHLYLLPVISSNKFDIDNLEIISNPIGNVLNNPQVWNQEVETYSFKMYTD